MEEKHQIGEIMGVTMDKIKEMIDVNTIVGEPIRTPDGITIIPVSKVSVGFASGGSDFVSKNQTGGKNPFGGGSGAGVNIAPVAFLVVNKDRVRLLPVGAPSRRRGRAGGGDGPGTGGQGHRPHRQEKGRKRRG